MSACRHFICVIALGATSSVAAEPERLDRFQLLQFRGKDGRTLAVIDA